MLFSRKSNSRLRFANVLSVTKTPLPPPLCHYANQRLCQLVNTWKSFKLGFQPQLNERFKIAQNNFNYTELQLILTLLCAKILCFAAVLFFWKFLLIQEIPEHSLHACLDLAEIFKDKSVASLLNKVKPDLITIVSV